MGKEGRRRKFHPGKRAALCPGRPTMSINLRVLLEKNGSASPGRLPAGRSSRTVGGDHLQRSIGA